MSSLTKVFAILVSVLAIFLCGAVVSFVTKTANWKQLYDQQKLIAAASQTQAVAADLAMSENKANYESMLERLEQYNSVLRQMNADLAQQLAVAQEARTSATGRADTAVQLSDALRLTIDNLYVTQNNLQKALEQDREKTMTAQTQLIELTRQLNTEQVKAAQLEQKWRQAEEKISVLENENADIRQKLARATVSPSEFRPDEDKVSLAPTSPTGVPIQGQVIKTDGGIVAISVGETSGVRKGMTFDAVRGGKYLGNLEITYVEPTQSVGQIKTFKETIIAGDKVISGLY